MAEAEKVLIVEDELHALTGLAELVSGWGYRTETARDGIEALDKVGSWVPGIIVTDLKMPRMDGFELLKRLNEADARHTVIVLTAQGSIERAVEAMKMGAYDFIQKPIEPARLKTVLASATHKRASEGELEATRSKLRSAGALGSLVGQSKQMQDIFSLIERVAPSTVSVLITGESGTGKEVVARTLHDLSPRRGKPFVAVNCAAIPETLIESEIFGHEKGSFTGALERRAGALSWRKKVPCCWTKLARCRSAHRLSSCACSKTASCAASAARSKCPWTCACLRRPTRIPIPLSRKAHCAATCITAQCV